MGDCYSIVTADGSVSPPGFAAVKCAPTSTAVNDAVAALLSKESVGWINIAAPNVTYGSLNLAEYSSCDFVLAATIDGVASNAMENAKAGTGPCICFAYSAAYFRRKQRKHPPFPTVDKGGWRCMDSG